MGTPAMMIEELKAAVSSFMQEGTRETGAFLEEYAAIRRILRDLEPQCAEDLELRSACEEAFKKAVTYMDRCLPGIVRTVYADAGEGLEEARTREEKIEAAMEARQELAPLLEYPEHKDAHLLQRAIKGLDECVGRLRQGS